MLRLLLLFMVVPAVELALLIEIGQHIGTLATLGLIVATGALGACLARWQGLGVLEKMRAEMQAGGMPAGSIADGVMILLAGAVLMTPGILTDAVGFLLLVPAVRRAIKEHLRRRFERAVRDGRATIVVETPHGPFSGGGGREIEIEAEPEEWPRRGA